MADTNKLQRTNVATGCGTPGRLISRAVAQDCVRLGSGSSLAAVDCPDFNRRLAVELTKLNLPDVVDLSVPVEQIQEADGFTGNHRLTLAKRDAWRPAVIATNDAHHLAVAGHNLSDPFSLFAYSYSGGHLPVTVELLADLQDRAVPGELRLGYALLSHEEALRDSTRENPWVGVRLKDAGFLEITALVDNRSAVDLQFGRPFKDALNVRAIAGLMTSSWQWANARGPADVTAHLGRYGALVGISHGLAHLPVETETPGWFSGVRRVTHDTARGKTSLATAIRMTKQACERAITDPAGRTIEDGPNLTLPSYLVVCVPKRRGRKKDDHDDAEWRELKAAVEDWLAATYATISVLWVAGPGIAHPEEGKRSNYHVQASLFHVLPDEPVALQKIVGQPNLKRRQRGIRTEFILDDPDAAPETETSEHGERKQLPKPVDVVPSGVSRALTLNGKKPDKGA